MKHISGLARLQFTRQPYTHWSLCFLGDPQIDFDIETQFQGRQMQSNVTSLISNQIRKAIRRKHTLPNYKLRYKPFFQKPIDEEIDLSEVHLDGMLDMNVVELTRLSLASNPSQVFCTLTLAPIAWVTARQHDDRTIVCSLDIEIHKAKNQQIGIVFKQLDNGVMVDAVIPNTPAMKAQLCKGDMLVSIEGKKIANIGVVAKIVKNLNRPVFVLRIERIVGGVIRNDVDTMTFDECADVEDSYEVINDMNISFSKTAETVQIGTKGRQSSCDRMSSDSSRSNTPTNSPIKTKESNVLRQRTSVSRHNSDAKSITPNDDNGSTKSLRIDATKKEKDEIELQPNEFEYPMHTTVDCPPNSFISINDLSQFKIEPSAMYLNLNVFGRTSDGNELLGYLNIPLHNVIFECNESTLGHLIKKFTLIPPDTPNLYAFFALFYFCACRKK